MALGDHILIAAYPLGSGIADLQDSYDGHSAQNMIFAGDDDLSGLPVADFNSSYYGVDNDLYNGFDTEYSFSMWLKPDTVAHSAMMVNEQHGSYYNTWSVYLLADGQLSLFCRDANGGAYDIANSTITISASNWSHIAATWSGTEIKWYINGALTSTTSASRVPWNSPATLWVGGNATKADKQYYDGKMSDLRFWYSELTASDISELYAAGQVPIDLGLVIHHDCDDATAEIGSDVTFTDVSIGTSSGRTHWDFANLNSKALLDVNNLPDMSGDWTVSMWFSEMTAPTTWRSIAKSQTELLGVVSSPHHTPANTLGVYTTGGYISAGYSMNYLEFQNWNHMVIVGSGTTTKFYINGSHVGTAPAKVSTDLYSINNQPVGAYNQLFANNMDDLRAWNRALSEIEVQALHLTTTVTPSLTDGLVAKYALDTDVTDSVGSNDGTSHGGAAFTSVSGRSTLTLSSNGDYAQIPASMNIGSGGEYTFSTWIKVDNFNSRQVILSDHVSGSTYPSIMIQLLQTSGRLSVWHYPSNGNSGNQQNFVSTGAITPGHWQLVTIVWDGTNMKAYFNGALDSSGSMTITPYNSNVVYRVGADTYPNTHVRGLMDDLHIWNRALSASEVTELHSSTQVLEDGLVAKYDLNTDATDSVGSNDGTATGATFAIANGRSHVSFDGSNDFIQISDPTALAGSTWTISQWIKTGKTSGRQDFFSQWYTSGGADTASIGLGTNGGSLKAYYRGNSGGSLGILTGPNVADDNWHHIVYVKSATEVRIYVDGSSEANASFSDSINSTSDLILGAWGTTAQSFAKSEWYDGEMDDLRIWSRALGASEVTTLHTETIVTPSLTDGLIHKWSLDTDGSAEVGSVDLVAHNSATHIDNVGSLPAIGSGFHPATSIALNPSAGYTISTWFKGLKSQAANFGNQFAAGGSSGTGGNWAGTTGYYDIVFDSTDLFVWDQIQPRWRRSGYDILSDTNLDTGWHNIVAAYDGTQTTFYVDGVQVGNPVTWGGSPSIQTFGSWKNLADRAPAEFMDDIRVWSRTLSASEISTLHAARAEASSGGASALIDITYGGQLSGVRAFDHNDSVFCYIAEESEAPSVYFGTDLSDFASFEKKTIINESSQPMSLEGKPMSLSMKSDDGSIYLGTRSGKLYHVAYNAGSNCVTKELFSGSSEVTKVHWDPYRSECLFETDGVIRSVDLSDTVSVKHTLAAGSMVEDFKAAPSGVAIVFRKADFTFEVMFVEGANWASPKASSQMIESVRAAKDFEYNSDLDMWVAATDDGQTSVGDLL